MATENITDDGVVIHNDIMAERSEALRQWYLAYDPTKPKKVNDMLIVMMGKLHGSLVIPTAEVVQLREVKNEEA